MKRFTFPAGFIALPLVVLAPLALGGCALNPVYAGGSLGNVGKMLGQVQVAPIPGESGWLVYNALINRIGGQQPETPRYRLDVTLDDQISAFGIRGDRAATQERRTLRARFQLVNLSTGLVVVDSTAGSDAGVDVVSSEYATVAAEQTALSNLSATLADQIVARLALFAGPGTSSR